MHLLTSDESEGYKYVLYVYVNANMLTYIYFFHIISSPDSIAIVFFDFDTALPTQ